MQLGNEYLIYHLTFSQWLAMMFYTHYFKKVWFGRNIKYQFDIKCTYCMHDSFNLNICINTFTKIYI